MTWIQTYTGKAFRLSDIKVDINDIAHHLSTRCRFNGACEPPYSVGEHSVRMSRKAQDLGLSVEVQRWCLFHDSGEAYLPDVPSPFKPSFMILMGDMGGVPFTYVEDLILEEVAKTLGMTVSAETQEIVKEIDLRFLATEKRDLMCKEPEPWFPMPEPYDFRIIPWQWHHAKRCFLQMYKELF